MKKYTGIRNHLFCLHKKNSYLQQQNQSPTHDDAHNPILNFSLFFFFFCFLSFFFFTNNCKFVYKTNKSVTFQNVLSHPHNISLYILNHDKSARQSLRNKASVFDGKYCRLVISNSSLLLLFQHSLYRDLQQVPDAFFIVIRASEQKSNNRTALRFSWM